MFLDIFQNLKINKVMDTTFVKSIKNIGNKSFDDHVLFDYDHKVDMREHINFTYGDQT